MNLVEPTIEHFHAIVSFINSQQQLDQWAGPNVRFPMTVNSLMSDLNLSTLSSYSLVGKNQELLAFGQFYERLRHCHLGRLIVAPEQRGKGIIAELIKLMSVKGCAEINTQHCSLFVFEDNLSAIKAYRHSGFKMADYPAEMPLEKCLYMTKKISL